MYTGQKDMTDLLDFYRERCTDGEAELQIGCDTMTRSKKMLMTSFEINDMFFFLILISIILIFECVFQLF